MTGIVDGATARYQHISDLLGRFHRPPARIVELGSAPGDQICALARSGYEATSVDLGVASDEWASAEDGRMTGLLLGAGVVDIRWDLQEAPYPLEDASFDAVIFTEVFEHLREYPVVSLREIARILRPGGHLFLTTPNQAYLANRIKLLLGRNVQSPLADWVGGLPFARHAREYTFAEMTELVEGAGLTVVSSESRHFYVDSGRSGLFSLAKRAVDAVARIRPQLGPEIVLVAEKTA